SFRVACCWRRDGRYWESDGGGRGVGETLGGIFPCARFFPGSHGNGSGCEGPLRGYWNGALLAHQEKESGEKEQSHAAENDVLKAVEPRGEHLDVFRRRGVAAGGGLSGVRRLPLSGRGSGGRAGEGDAEDGSRGNVIPGHEREALVGTCRGESIPGNLDALRCGEHDAGGGQDGG